MREIRRAATDDDAQLLGGSAALLAGWVPAVAPLSAAGAGASGGTWTLPSAGDAGTSDCAAGALES
jgi:hypothetical protein